MRFTILLRTVANIVHFFFLSDYMSRSIKSTVHSCVFLDFTFLFTYKYEAKLISSPYVRLLKKSSVIISHAISVLVTFYQTTCLFWIVVKLFFVFLKKHK